MMNLTNIFESITDIQYTQLKLLNEFHQLCQLHNIEYSVSGDLLAYIANGEHRQQKFNFISIQVTPQNHKKLIKAIPNFQTKNYALECSITNEILPSSYIRFTDLNTTHINLLSDRHQHKGIHLTIYPYPAIPKDGIILSTLKTVQSAFPKLINIKSYLKLANEERIKKHQKEHKHGEPISIDICDKSIETSNDLIEVKIDTKKDTFKFYAYKEAVLNAKKQIPRLKISTPKNISHFENFICHNTSYIISSEADYKLNKIDKIKFLYTIAFYNLYTKILKEIETLEFAHPRFLTKCSFNLHSTKLEKEYKDKLETLKRLQKKNDLERLSDELENFSDYFEYYYRKGHILDFNKELTNIYIELQKNTGYHAYANELKNSIKTR